MSRRFLALVVGLALALAVVTGLVLTEGSRNAQPQSALIGGPFQLVDTMGHTVDQSQLRGKWSVVFFGFTHCPDICPTTLFELAQVETLLGNRAKQVQTVFITLDPQRDTVAQMRAYAANEGFPKRLVALTGSAAQVDAAAKSYRVFYQKVGDGPDYSVNHASYSYLMNPHGGFACVLPYALSPEQTADKIKAAMRAGADAQAC